jgi:hypothetical protein
MSGGEGRSMAYGWLPPRPRVSLPPIMLRGVQGPRVTASFASPLFEALSNQKLHRHASSTSHAQTLTVVSVYAMMASLWNLRVASSPHNGDKRIRHHGLKLNYFETTKNSNSVTETADITIPGPFEHTQPDQRTHADLGKCNTPQQR